MIWIRDVSANNNEVLRQNFVPHHFRVGGPRQQEPAPLLLGNDGKDAADDNHDCARNETVFGENGRQSQDARSHRAGKEEEHSIHIGDLLLLLVVAGAEIPFRQHNRRAHYRNSGGPPPVLL